MTLEQQVCSLDLAKRLKELGVKQESYFWWVDPSDGTREEAIWFIRDNHVGYKEHVSAFTVAELGEMLPKIENLVSQFFDNGHCQIALMSEGYQAASIGIEADTEADARAKMLIYLLENKLITLCPS